MDTPIEIETIQLTPSFTVFEQNDLSKKEMMRMKKEERRLRYINSEEELNTNDFEELKLYKLASININNIDPTKRKAKSNYYIDSIVWDEKALDKISLDEKIDRENMKAFLMPHNAITYEEAEYLLSNNPTHLVATMTLLSNNYIRNIEIIEGQTKTEDTNYQNCAHFLFTDPEEITFLTGRTLLVEYNKTIRNKHTKIYIENLISEIDGIILRFNQGLVADIAKAYKEKVDHDDLINSGFEGFINALEGFDIDTGNRLSTYVSWHILDKIQDAVSENNFIYIPEGLNKAVDQVFGKIKELNQKGKEATIDDAIQACHKDIKGFPKTTHYIKMAIFSKRQIISLDESNEDENNKRDSDKHKYKSLTKEDNSVEDILDKRKFNKNLLYQLFDLANLDKEERHVLKLKFGIIPNRNNTKKPTHTRREVGNILGKSEQEVKNIEIRSITRLKTVVRARAQDSAALF